MRRAARFFQKRAAHIFCFVNRMTAYKSIIRLFKLRSNIFYRQNICISFCYLQDFLIKSIGISFLTHPL